MTNNMINLPKIRTNRGNVGNDIFVRLPDLSSFETTYLSGDEAAAQTVLSVLQGTNFSANEFVLIGTPGTEQAEIKKVSSSAAGTITLSSGLSYDHPQGTQITFIPFDQIEIYSASTSGGSYSLLGTISIRSDAFETYYPRTADASTVFYKARFKNSNDTTYSDYSDEVSATGYAFDTVYSIKKRALDQLGEKMEGIITDEFLNDSLWEGRREIDNQVQKLSFRTHFDADIANVVEGQYSIPVPTDLRDKNSPENILGLKLGRRGRNISYISKRQFDQWYQGIFHTTVATQPSVGGTTLTLTNARDLDDSGSVQIGSNLITYTSKSDTTGILSGIPSSGTGSITATHAVGKDVWQHASFGEPTLYTIFEETIFFNVPLDNDFDGDNIYMDYYSEIEEFDSDADVVDEPDPDCLVSYLKYKIKDKKEKGKVKKDTDPDYQDYLARRTNMLRGERITQDVGFVPDIGHLIDAE